MPLKEHCGSNWFKCCSCSKNSSVQIESAFQISPWMINNNKKSDNLLCYKSSRSMRTKHVKAAFSFYAAQIWNTFPEHLRSATALCFWMEAKKCCLPLTFQRVLHFYISPPLKSFVCEFAFVLLNIFYFNCLTALRSEMSCTNKLALLCIMLL